MKRALNLPILGAVFTALLSTACCLPAFLFLFFGVSSGTLGFLTQMEFLRVPMAVLTILFFALGVYKFRQKVQCSCEARVSNSAFIKAFFITLLLCFTLFYPEIIPLFMES